ncbi:MAG: hypothetical protein GY906_29960, partial [bacterium]|nr:hypothetical protein [bacterium]
MTGSDSVVDVTLVRGFLVGSILAVLVLAVGGVDAWDADLDSSFNSNGKFPFAMHSGESSANAVAVQPDGKIVVAGSSHNGSDFDFAVVRMTPEGNLDTTFDGDGRAFFDFGWGDDYAGDVAI